jgi:hypothetical protein
MAATLELHNCHTSPFIFFKTDILEHFCNWLVLQGVKSIANHLSVLFFEGGVPIPHAYIVALTNYNMRMETDELKEQAIAMVHKSVTNTFFDAPSNTLNHIAAFIRLHHNNLHDQA